MELGNEGRLRASRHLLAQGTAYTRQTLGSTSGATLLLSSRCSRFNCGRPSRAASARTSRGTASPLARLAPNRSRPRRCDWIADIFSMARNVLKTLHADYRFLFLRHAVAFEGSRSPATCRFAPRAVSRSGQVVVDNVQKLGALFSFLRRRDGDGPVWSGGDGQRLMLRDRIDARDRQRAASADDCRAARISNAAGRTRRVQVGGINERYAPLARARSTTPRVGASFGVGSAPLRADERS
jgi:hypothetical protein